MKKLVGIIAGGDSSEYEVSLRSAMNLYHSIDTSHYEPMLVLLRGSDWHALLQWEKQENTLRILQQSAINKNDFSFEQDGVVRRIDIAYITIHGTPGENGLLQGYLEMLKIPHSTGDTLTEALTFNKYACNHYLSTFGIRIAQSILLHRGEEYTTEMVVGAVGLPCFVKSNVGGSSIGCTKVKEREGILPAIERAFQEGDEVICETFMDGIEITCGVYKNKDGVVALPITEVVSQNEFFDYDAKYNGAVEEITPARLSDALTQEVQTLTKKIYKLLNCKGIIRVDYILTSSSNGYDINLLEINTTPGMTDTSFVPQQVRAAGKELKNVLTEVLESI